MAIKLYCKQPIALDSPDHISPEGTKRDNSINLKFNDKLYRLFNKPQLRVLDLGCAGGGFVQSLIDEGNIAVGLEGSDYSKKMKRAAWRNIPDNLFTCDITKGFALEENGKLMLFDVITAWEVFEHIKEEDLAPLVRNLSVHLKPNGLLIFSINTLRSHSGELELHQTIQSEREWSAFFVNQGFKLRDDLLEYFNNNFVRGKSRLYKGSFNIILSLPNNDLKVPPRSFKLKLWEYWQRSFMHRLIKTLVLGEVYL